MRSTVLMVLVSALLLPAHALAEGDVDGVVKAGSTNNRFTIKVVNPSRETPIGGMQLGVAGDGEWITNIRIQANSEGALGPGATRTYTITFDVKRDAEEGATDSIGFNVSAQGALVDDAAPRMTVRIAGTDAKASIVRVHPLRQGGGREYLDDDSYLLCDYGEQRVFNIEPVWLFLKPGRLVEVEQAQDGLRLWHGSKPAGWTGRKPRPGGPEPEGDWDVRIVGPDGKPCIETRYQHRYQWEGDGGGPRTARHVVGYLNPTTGDAPAPLAIMLDTGRLELPGRYTVQTRPYRPDAVDDPEDDPPLAPAARGDGQGSAVFGQLAGDGSATESIRRPRNAPWHTEGTFVILDSRLHFQGFVTEKSVPVRDNWVGQLTLQTTMADTKASMTLRAKLTLKDWVDRPVSERPEYAEKRASGHLTLELPLVIPAGVRGGGWGAARYQVLEGELEVYAKVPGFIRATAAPDRSLASATRYSAGIDVFQTDEPWDPGSVPESAWSQIRVGGAGNRISEEYRNLRVAYTVPEHPWAAYGRPERTLQWHLRDPQARIYLLVDFHVRSWHIYGFGIYGLSAEPYAGPSPGAPPGAGLDEGVADVTTPDRSPTSDDVVDTDSGQPPGDAMPRVDPAVPGGGRPPVVVPGPDPSEGTRPTGSINPATLNPRDPDVAALIREWISNARPPENAVPGANCRYDQFGRVVGTALSARTIRTHDSVDYRDGTPEETVWGLRNKLDSVDHGTLKEYVVARLEGKPIGSFTGRYRGVRDLKGVGLAEAKAAVTGAGLTFTLAPGTPAETPEDEGTIEQQDPAWRQYLRKGQTLKLTVHSPYVPDLRTLPDFVGMSLAESRKWLEKNKLRPFLRPGSAAPAREKSGTVEAQDPAKGTVMQAGGEVTLTVHAPYAQGVTVPDLTGLSLADAKDKLRNIDLMLRPTLLGPAPELGKAATVAGQKPSATVRVAAGSTVHVDVYGDYAPPGITVPDVSGMALADAKRTLERAGVGIAPTLLGAAPDPSRSRKVRAQRPAAGTALSPGSTVQVEVWSDYVAPGTAIPDVRGLTLTDAKRALERAGLVVQPSLLGPAREAARAHRIGAQKPLPGTMVAPGTTVTVDVWGDYERPGGSSTCEQIPGVWQWSNGWVVSLCPKSMSFAPHPAKSRRAIAWRGNRIVEGGFWSCSVRDGKAYVSIHWIGTPTVDLTLSGGQLVGKRRDETAVSATKTSNRPDPRASNGRNSDCDLIGRFGYSDNEKIVEIGTQDGINYVGRLVHVKVGGFWWGQGYRPGGIYFKLKRSGPNDMGGSDYVGQEYSVYGSGWDEVPLLRVNRKGFGLFERRNGELYGTGTFWERLRQ